MVLCMYWKVFCLHPSFYLLVSWARWDWPLTRLTNRHPSVLWHCWLGHLTCKIVSEMTYNVASGTLNTTILYLGHLTCKIVSEMTYNVASGTLNPIYHTVSRYCALATSLLLFIRHTWLSAFSDQAFPVTAACLGTVCYSIGGDAIEAQTHVPPQILRAQRQLQSVPPQILAVDLAIELGQTDGQPGCIMAPPDKSEAILMVKPGAPSWCQWKLAVSRYTTRHTDQMSVSFF